MWIYCLLLKLIYISELILCTLNVSDKKIRNNYNDKKNFYQIIHLELYLVIALLNVINRLLIVSKYSFDLYTFFFLLYQILIYIFDYIFEGLKCGIFVTIEFRAGISSTPFEYFHYRSFASLQYRGRVAKKNKRIAKKFFFSIQWTMKNVGTYFSFTFKKNRNKTKFLLKED